ncbi:tRNA pseudouridine synthase-like 1 [Ornithodoros turicata]|uniref:tRNA pseudouridine synthase-like 1 n=1 Tax=Ornithodoros turicata TaxID=34597 RepID=UPI003139BF6C
MSSRYLLRFSYLGTKYRGMQRQSARPNIETCTVQGVIETALQRLNPLSEPGIVLASRTDRGVHAIVNAAHTDLVPSNTTQSFHPDFITSVVNYYLTRNGHDVIIRKTEQVPGWFHSRHLAHERSYVYRVAVLKPHLLEESAFKTTYRMYLPIAELNQCHVIPQLNLDRVHEAMELMSGTHDFRSFKNVNRTHEQEMRPTIKEILTFQLRPSPRMSSFPDPNYENVELWEFYIKSKSFLYRQVRRMVSAALYASSGTHSLDSIRDMLRKPDKLSWDSRIIIVPPCGLFLSGIEYDKKYFDLDCEPPEEILSCYNRFNNAKDNDESDDTEETDPTDEDSGQEVEEAEKVSQPVQT